MRELIHNWERRRRKKEFSRFSKKDWNKSTSIFVSLIQQLFGDAAGEISFMDYYHSEDYGYVDNESEEIKNVITQKKRTYRLEIRKKKL